MNTNRDVIFHYQSVRKGRHTSESSNPYQQNEDAIIEDWGTGIENYENFTTISPRKKQVRNEISSCDKVNEKIIGQKGMGKFILLNLSNEHKGESFSNNEKLGMHIVMTMDDDSGGYEYMNGHLALPHHGVKIVIKKAKRTSESRLVENLSKGFALRIADGLLMMYKFHYQKHLIQSNANSLM
jgi:hypothetical protein